MSTMLGFNMNVGELTELKVKKLQSLFEQLPSRTFRGNQLILSGDKEQIIITSEKVEISVMHKNFSDVQNNIKKIQELLMVNETLNTPLIVIAHLMDIKRNSMFFCKESFGVLTKSSIGSGIRELFTYNNNLCEFKVEPYLDNNQYIFLEFRYNFRELTVNSIKEVLENVTNDHSSKFDEICVNLKLDL